MESKTEFPVWPGAGARWVGCGLLGLIRNVPRSRKREKVLPVVSISQTTENMLSKDLDGPDPDFAALAAEASRGAIERAFAAGLSVSYLEGGHLYRRFPDGRILEISEQERQAILEGRTWP